MDDHGSLIQRLRHAAVVRLENVDGSVLKQLADRCHVGASAFVRQEAEDVREAAGGVVVVVVGAPWNVFVNICDGGVRRWRPNASERYFDHQLDHGKSRAARQHRQLSVTQPAHRPAVPLAHLGFHAEGPVRPSRRRHFPGVERFLT